MEITVFRVDDRLIHGQIVTAWLNHADAKIIICADDLAAKDDFQKMLLEMATPKSVVLKVLSIEESIKLLLEDDSETKTLLLVRGSNEAFRILEKVKDIKSLNIGNINMKPGKTKILSNLWVDEKDIAGFKKIMDLNIEIEVRAVPNEKSQNVIDLLKKNNLL